MRESEREREREREKERERCFERDYSTSCNPDVRATREKKNVQNNFFFLPVFFFFFFRQKGTSLEFFSRARSTNFIIKNLPE